VFSFIKDCLQTKLSSLPTEFFGIDIAKTVDWTVITGLDKNGKVSYFDRFQKDWAQTKSMILSLPDKPTLIDSTGVGDSFAEDLNSIRANITGFKYTTDSKQKLIKSLAQAVQSKSVGVLGGVMQEEMESFEFIYNPHTGNVKYSAPEGEHDDATNSLALAYKCMRDKQDLNKFDYMVG
jgi:hypothetical protein